MASLQGCKKYLRGGMLQVKVQATQSTATMKGFGPRQQHMLKCTPASAGGFKELLDAALRQKEYDLQKLR